MASQRGYKLQRLLGSGHFGEVFLANKGGRSFAIKKVVNTEQNTAQQEIKILKQVDHEYIIKYFDHFMENRILCIVLEYADKGTLADAVKRYNKEEHQVWRITSHLSGALAYLHSRNPQILHHDLKPDNILGVGSYCPKERRHLTNWKLADFGVAKLLTWEAQQAYYGAEEPGIPSYMGPEVLRDFETYSAASDVWSLGCVIAFYMRDGEHVFDCNEEVLYYDPEMASDIVFTDECYDNYSSTLINLVSNMIQTVPRKRPSAQKVSNMCTSKRQAIPDRY